MTAPPEADGSEPIYVGIDFGGTKIFGALVGARGTISDETYVEHGGRGAPPGSFTGEEAALGRAYERLVELAQSLCATARARGRQVAGVGIGAPGIISTDGTVVTAGSLAWKNVPLGPLIERRLGVPVRIENDVNLQAVGEHSFGAGRGTRSMFLIAIGTGIGGGLIIDGKLWRGRNFAAGEIGALLPGPEFLRWTDRDWGAFEAYASGTGLGIEARLAAQAAGADMPPAELRGERLFAAAAAGVPWARAVVDRAVDLWTVAIGAVQVIIDPDVVVVSGGVAGSVAAYLPHIAGRLAQALPLRPQVTLSQLGYRAGVLGAPGLFTAG